MTLRPGFGAKALGISPAKKRLSVDEKGLLISFIALLVMGLVVLYAASYYNAQDKGNPLSDVLSQLLGVGVGAVGMVLVLRVDYRVLQNSAVCLGLVALSLLLLVLVAIPGVGRSINGSRRWLNLGFVGFQPSELAKYSMVAYMARALAARRRDLRRLFRGLLPLFLVPGAMFLLILQQPNLSTAGSIVIVAALMVMLAGAKWSHLSFIGVCGAAVGAFYALSEEYRRERLMSFRDPWKYLSDEGYQLAQSLLAFGSGGWFGMGLGRGRQKYAFLPYPESDFIFAVVGEDMGLAGCLLILGLFVAFEFFAFRIALRCPDRFGALLAGGIACMIGVQCALNVAVVIGLIPTTGLPLPFFSAGGTSISILMCAVAVLLNVSRRSGA